jgi:hypothetical protein
MPIICRKCGGDHLTIKCGKNTEKPVEKPVEISTNKSDYKSTNNNKSDYKFTNNNKSEYKSDYKSDKTTNNIRNKIVRKVNKPTYEKYSVCITNLPDDIELINIQYMMMDWGKIGNINMRYSEDKGKMCYVDFYNKEHKDYFIKALDKTPVGSNIINILSI